MKEYDNQNNLINSGSQNKLHHSVNSTARRTNLQSSYSEISQNSQESQDLHFLNRNRKVFEFIIIFVLLIFFIILLIETIYVMNTYNRKKEVIKNLNDTVNYYISTRNINQGIIQTEMPKTTIYNSNYSSHTTSKISTINTISKTNKIYTTNIIRTIDTNI